MKFNQILRILVLSGLLLAGLSFYSTSETFADSTGAPTGRTGSPGDFGNTCAAGGCHSSFGVQTVSGWITTDIPANGYTAGQMYTITCTANGPGHVRFGFEASPQDLNGNRLGTMKLINSSITKLVGGGKYITHTSGGTTGTDQRVWTFNWTAPTNDSATFYACFNVTNNDGTSFGDQIYKTSLTLHKTQATAVAEGAGIPALKIYPNPAAEWLQIEAAPDTRIATLTVLNLAGRLVYHSSTWSGTKLEVSGLEPGIYFLRLTDEQGRSATRCFVKQ